MCRNRKVKTLTMVFALMIISNLGFSQTGEIQIRYIGNCGLHITDGVFDIYTDFPYKSGAHHYVEYDDSEIDSLKENAYYIFTHKHSDHYYKGKMNKILKEKNGEKYGKWNIDELENLDKTIPEFEIEAYKTKHLFSFAHYSYLITWHGKKIFLSGDTESAETIGQIKDMDWAFIPAWLLMDAMDNDIEIDAKKIAIYHIGPGDDIEISGPKSIMLKKQGEAISVPY